MRPLSHQLTILLSLLCTVAAPFSVSADTDAALYCRRANDMIYLLAAGTNNPAAAAEFLNDPPQAVRQLVRKVSGVFLHSFLTHAEAWAIIKLLLDKPPGIYAASGGLQVRVMEVMGAGICHLILRNTPVGDNKSDTTSPKPIRPITPLE